jgi:hypothetical protein
VPQPDVEHGVAGPGGELVHEQFTSAGIVWAGRPAHRSGWARRGRRRRADRTSSRPCSHISATTAGPAVVAGAVIPRRPAVRDQ